MTNEDILIIRACKSKNPSQRLQSVIKRFYITKGVDYKQQIIILLEVCEKYTDLNARYMINNINLHMDDAYEKQVRRCLINKICFTDFNTLPDDFRKPAIFRNRNNR